MLRNVPHKVVSVTYFPLSQINDQFIGSFSLCFLYQMKLKMGKYFSRQLNK